MLDFLGLEITGQCNLQCQYCCRSEINVPSKINSEITLQELKNIIAEAQQLGVKCISLAGGEPFMHNDFSSICKSIRVYLEVVTNGTYIKDDNIDILSEIEIDSLRISLDGLEGHNKIRVGSNYETIIEGIDKIKKNCRTHITISTLVGGDNLSDLQGLYNIVRKYNNIVRWNLDFPQYVGRMKAGAYRPANITQSVKVFAGLVNSYLENHDSFQLKIFGLYNSRLDLTQLDCDVDTNPCSYMIDRAMFIRADRGVTLCPSHGTSIMNLQSSLRDTLDMALTISELSEWGTIKRSNLSECLKCRYINLCQGGCRFDAYNLNNSWHAPDRKACSLWYNAEKYFIPYLPKNLQSTYVSYIKEEGMFPKCVRVSERGDR